MADALIEASNLSATYGQKIIWQGANFKVKQGEFIALLGPNGAGKTTLFRLLLGLARPARGQLRVLNQKPKSAGRRIGYVPQRHQFELEPRLQASEYVKLGLDGHRLGFNWPSQAAKADQLARKALAKVGAADLASQPLSRLSGGEVQRVFLAEALVGQPELLLLDEPLANLDIKRANQLIRLIHDLTTQQSLSVILIAHDINPLLPFIDRIIYIAGGQVASGKPDEVINSQTLSKLYQAEVEVLRDSRGRLAVLGTEEAVHHE